MAFRRTLLTLDVTARKMLTHFRDQMTRLAPSADFLAEILRELRRTFKNIQENAQSARPVLDNLPAYRATTACLKSFQ